MYYPKSQIKSNLYTNGNEYILSTTKEPYKGYYYEVSNGSKYTGKFPGDDINILLILPESSIDPRSANDSNPIDQIVTYPSTEYTKTLPTRSIPIFNITLPTDQDNQNGQFSRYFCKKNNELRYLEIDKDTYQKLQKQDKQIAWDLYTPVIVLWQIKGNKEQVYNSNKGTVISIEQNLSWTGFTQYFKENYLKYYLES
jgi:hypothetical protein